MFLKIQSAGPDAFISVCLCCRGQDVHVPVSTWGGNKMQDVHVPVSTWGGNRMQDVHVPVSTWGGNRKIMGR